LSVIDTAAEGEGECGEPIAAEGDNQQSFDLLRNFPAHPVTRLLSDADPIKCKQGSALEDSDSVAKSCSLPRLPPVLFECIIPGHGVAVMRLTAFRVLKSLYPFDQNGGTNCQIVHNRCQCYAGETAPLDQAIENCVGSIVGDEEGIVPRLMRITFTIIIRWLSMNHLVDEFP
jgi:hypothetical protein